MSDAVNVVPQSLWENVYCCQSELSEGSRLKSFIVLHEQGNWMIDSPKYSHSLVDWLHKNGGLKYIFLTHRDNIGEEYDYAWEFGARRIMHGADLDAEPNAEIVLSGAQQHKLEKDFIAIPASRLSPGHCSLLYKETFLFTGEEVTFVGIDLSC